MRNVTILRVAMPLAVAAVLALAGPASGDWVYWGGSEGGLYSVDANWSGGAKPQSWKDAGNPHDYAVVAHTGYCVQNTPEYPWDVIVGGVTDRLYYVIEAGADLAVNEIDCGAVFCMKLGGLEQRGGNVTNAFTYDEFGVPSVAADGINVGCYEDVAGKGGFYKITGGVIDFPGPLRVGGANAGGLFHVVGTAPTIGVASYLQGASGTLQVDLVGGAVAPINVSGSGDVTLAGSLVLSGLATAPVTIMTYEGALDGTFTNVTAGWTVDYSTSGVITVVPEPATMSILAVGAIAMIRRRSRYA